MSNKAKDIDTRGENVYNCRIRCALGRAFYAIFLYKNKPGGNLNEEETEQNRLFDR